MDRAKLPAPTIPVRITPFVLRGLTGSTGTRAAGGADECFLEVESRTATCLFCFRSEYASGASVKGQTLPIRLLKSTFPSAMSLRYSAMLRFSVQRTYAYG